MNAFSGGEGAKPKGDEVAAELMRIEMMEASLALSGEGESASLRSPSLAALLKGIARYAESAAPAQPQGYRGPPLQGGNEASGEITRTASRFLGIPYLFGGEDKSGIDCSSFVQQVFREHNIELPRTAREQIKVGSEVARGELKEGDLVFFRTYASYPSHVGIYLGNGKMIHASSRHGEVTVSDMDSDYFRSRFLGGKRVA